MRPSSPTLVSREVVGEIAQEVAAREVVLEVVQGVLVREVQGQDTPLQQGDALLSCLII